MALQDILTERFSGLLSGGIRPWELPEFQGIENILGKRGALARKGAGRQMRMRGIEGPAVGKTLLGMEEAQHAPLASSIRDIYGQMTGGGMQWGQHLGQLDMMMRQLEEQRKGRMGRESIAKRGQMMDLAKLLI